MAIQVIETQKLSSQENLWLKSLSGDLTAERIQEILTASVPPDRHQHLRAYLDVLISSNPKTIKEVLNKVTGLRLVLEETGIAEKMRMDGAEDSFQDGFQRGIQKGRQTGHQTGLQEGLQTGVRQVAKNMLAAGMSTAQIVTATKLTTAQINKLRKELIQ
jgi:predicted transposase YdaD